ncbi:hypothetical protein [Streptomyces sp. NRRL S-813]|uniref:hypothetical protein n=1 Tax=Streptomyces sp. NRRL S-813 TaxID=1463919 RepID=UPI0004C23D7A|nr:hypothetical protein [Streptomyces sp. NRRL S-813]
MAATRKTSSKSGEGQQQVRQRQFPAKAGAPAAEVDERSADGAKGTRHVKEFVVQAARWTGEDYQHEANRAGVVNEAIQRGLHPRGKVSFDGQEEHPDGLSLILTYSVDTVPASVDDRPEDTTTPRDVIDGDTSKSKSEG